MSDEKDESLASEVSSLGAELKVILRLGWPNSVNMFFSFVPGVLMLSFLRSDPEALAAAGMGFMFSNVSGISMIVGFGAGASPLIAQAYGAKNFPRCGELLQRQLAIHVVVLAVVAAIWLKTEEILVFFHQPSGVAKLTGQFMRWRVIALPFFAFKEDLCNYLIAQGSMTLPMIVGVVANVLNIVLYPILIAQLGFVGAPLAMTIANILQGLLMGLLSYRVLPTSETWPAWSLHVAFRNWSELLKLALPSGILMLSEWWGWEINLFFAGLLCEGDKSCVELDVFPIVSNTMVISFMFHIGFSIAAGAEIGNALGAGNTMKAQLTSNVTIKLVVCIAGTISMLLIVFRWQWGVFFSTDPVVVHRTGEVLPWVAAYIFLDAIGPSALICILRGMAVVKLPALFNFLAFYALGIPVGLGLTFGQRQENWGIVGLWIGLVLGMFTMVVSCLTYLFFGIDWHHVTESARAQALGEQNGNSAKVAKRPEEGQILGKPSYKKMASDDSFAENCVDKDCEAEGDIPDINTKGHTKPQYQKVAAKLDIN